MAGGITREPRGDLDGETISSVVTLLPKATTWTLLSPLPRRLDSAASSMVGGRLWLVGGRGPAGYRAEVGGGEEVQIIFIPRYCSMSPPQTHGQLRATSRREWGTTEWWPWAYRTCPASGTDSKTRATRMISFKIGIKDQH